MNKGLIILLIVGILSTPLILVYLCYGGFGNIPHNDITMWTFLLVYLLFSAVILTVVLFVLPQKFVEFTIPELKTSKQTETKSSEIKNSPSKPDNNSKNKKGKKKVLTTKKDEKEKKLEE